MGVNQYSVRVCVNPFDEPHVCSIVSGIYVLYFNTSSLSTDHVEIVTNKKVREERECIFMNLSS